MKIAFIGQKGVPVNSGGVERRVSELSVRMAKKGYDVFVYARKGYVPAKLKKFKGVNLIFTPFIKNKNLEAISHTFISILHALFQNYDVIHFQAPGPSSLCWIIKILKPRVALVATFNSRDSKHQKWGKIARYYLNFSEKIISKVPDKTIVVSEILKSYVKKKFKKNTVVIHNGSYVRKTYNQDELEKWDVSSKKYFLSVSRLIRHKGIHYLVKAFIGGQESGRIPADFKLVITGEGAYTDDYVSYLREISRENKNIIFTGNQTGESLGQLYFHSYAFVQPSETEGLSNSLLEAMGYGIAPIVSDIPENLAPVGKNGIIFPNKDTEILKERLIFAIRSRSLMKKLGQEAKKNIELNYNWEENTKRTLKIYEEIVLNKKGYFGRFSEFKPV